MATRKKGAKGKAARPAKARKAAPAKKATRKSKPAAAKAPPAAKAAAPAPNPWAAYAANLGRESAVTLKVMRAFPADQTSFQPHPRSSSALRLFWTFAVEQGISLDAIRGTLKMPPSFPPPPATLAECASVFERNVAAVIGAAKAAAASDHARLQPFFGGPSQLVNLPAGAIADMMLADQIHHRGQLSVYVRMAGGKVPSIYGPSADEPW